MLRHEKVGLRARHSEDVSVLHAELYDDVAEHGRADGGPWQPKTPGHDWSPFAVREPSESTAVFSVVELDTDELAGSATVHYIDAHNRTAELGMWLRPGHRGRGLGLGTLRALCVYGFSVRGLNRLQLQTLADNHAMLATAGRAGFTREGTLRNSAWANGSFTDEVLLGILAQEWRDAAPVG